MASTPPAPAPIRASVIDCLRTIRRIPFCFSAERRSNRDFTGAPGGNCIRHDRVHAKSGQHQGDYTKTLGAPCQLSFRQRTIIQLIERIEIANWNPRIQFADGSGNGRGKSTSIAERTHI